MPEVANTGHSDKAAPAVYGAAAELSPWATPRLVAAPGAEGRLKADSSASSNQPDGQPARLSQRESSDQHQSSEDEPENLSATAT